MKKTKFSIPEDFWTYLGTIIGCNGTHLCMMGFKCFSCLILNCGNPTLCLQTSRLIACFQNYSTKLFFQCIFILGRKYVQHWSSGVVERKCHVAVSGYFPINLQHWHAILSIWWPGIHATSFDWILSQPQRHLDSPRFARWILLHGVTMQKRSTLSWAYKMISSSIT